MHIVIVGCGRVGSTLALQLQSGGHDVCVVDRNTDSFRRLGTDFAGSTVVGVGFDRDVLTEAGVTPDTLVAAVTSGDNSNILIARVARELFGASRVVARIYDPARASIYERLGIHTVASVAWTVSRVTADLFPDMQPTVWSDPTTSVGIREFRVSATLAGTPVSDIEARTGSRIVCLTRAGIAVLPGTADLVQQDDLLHVASLRTADLSALTDLVPVASAAKDAH
jgi:trk system potassium uptake protein